VVAAGEAARDDGRAAAADGRSRRIEVAADDLGRALEALDDAGVDAREVR
jgi:hypothetical protein